MKTKIAAIMGAAALLGAITQTASGSAHDKLLSEKAAAANVTTAQANAMQAAAVAVGQANSTLSNPFIEQKVNTPESTGQNSTGVPAGGF